MCTNAPEKSMIFEHACQLSLPNFGMQVLSLQLILVHSAVGFFLANVAGVTFSQ